MFTVINDNLRTYKINDNPNKSILLTFSTQVMQQKQNKGILQIIFKYHYFREVVCFWATWSTFLLISSFNTKNTFFTSNNTIFIIITYTHPFHNF